jgi:hypothetical protein
MNFVSKTHVLKPKKKNGLMGFLWQFQKENLIMKKDQTENN